jgi:hypothetical protein
MRTQFTVTITNGMIQSCIDATTINGLSQKLHAIKELRTRYGVGLREAKELVEMIICPPKRYRRTIQTVSIHHDFVDATSSDHAWNKPIPRWISDLPGDVYVINAELN